MEGPLNCDKIVYRWNDKMKSVRLDYKRVYGFVVNGIWLILTDIELFKAPRNTQPTIIRITGLATYDWGLANEQSWNWNQQTWFSVKACSFQQSDSSSKNMFKPASKLIFNSTFKTLSYVTSFKLINFANLEVKWT